MNIKQRLLKIFHPILSASARLIGKHNRLLVNTKKVQPITSVYDLGYTAINGRQVSLKDYKGKYLLIVNTASNCGYTAQYEDLEKINNDFHEKLVVIGFPSNDFRQQEKGSDEEIQQFCTVNFGVSFPLSTKIMVRKGAGQHSLYRWLSDHSMNGWNNTAPSWNFSKYIIDPNGVLIAYADAAIKPSALMSYLGRTG